MSRRIAAFGEILWDLLPEGRALGGAPFNLAFRMYERGHDAVMISAVGDDELGRKAVAAVTEMGLERDNIQVKSGYPTGTVDIVFDESGQPDYTITPDVAYDHITYQSDFDELAASIECLCFGTLCQRSPQSRETLSQLLDRAEAAGGVLRFLDINLRKECYTRSIVEDSLERADILKANEEETRQLADFFGMECRQLSDVARRLRSDWELDYCVVTLGPRGAACVDPDDRFHYSPGYDVDVVDPCGAGDAFAAGFLDEIMKGSSTEKACQVGNLLGAAVAGQRSATQPVKSEQLERLADAPSERVHDHTIDH